MKNRKHEDSAERPRESESSSRRTMAVRWAAPGALLLFARLASACGGENSDPATSSGAGAEQVCREAPLLHGGGGRTTCATGPALGAGWSRCCLGGKTGPVVVDAVGALIATGLGDDETPFLVKFDAAGAHQWSKTFSEGTEFDAITVAGARVVATGHFRDSVNFGGGALVGPGYELFVARMDGSGNHLWSRAFARAFADEMGQGGAIPDSAVAVGPDGSVYVTGSFTGTVDFGGGPLTAFGGTDAFVVKLDGEGNHVWSRRYGGSSEGFFTDAGRSIAVAASVVVSGLYTGPVDFGGGPLADGNPAVFLLALDTDGNHTWSQGMIASTTIAPHVVWTTGGYVLLVGTAGEIRLGDAALTGFFLAEFDASGTYVQAKGYPAGGEVSAVATDESGNVLLAGVAQSTAVDFGGGELLGSGGFADGLLVKLNSSWAHLGSQRFGGAEGDLATGIAVGSMGHVGVSGYTTSSETGGPEFFLGLGAIDPM